MQARMSMITLGVADLSRARTFYKDGLGLPLVDLGDGDEVAFFNLNGTWLGLFPWEELAKDAGIDVNDVEFLTQKDSTFRGVTIAHNLISEAAVDAQMQEAEAAGAKIIRVAQKVFWGGYSGKFADLDGHLWEIAHNPFSWIGPADMTEGAAGEK